MKKNKKKRLQQLNAPLTYLYLQFSHIVASYCNASYCSHHTVMDYGTVDMKTFSYQSLSCHPSQHFELR